MTVPTSAPVPDKEVLVSESEVEEERKGMDCKNHCALMVGYRYK